MRRDIEFDTRELRDLEIDLAKAPLRIRDPKALKSAARVVEREMKVGAAGHVGSYFTPKKRHKSATDLPRYVSSELITSQVAEIGVESRGAGALAHIIAYGVPGISSPAWDVNADVRRALPGVESQLGDHAEESVLGKGGGR